MSFDSIPILDLSLAQNPSTKPAFLKDLRHALLEVGFLYIRNAPGISDELVQKVITLGKQFFELPEDKKLECEMKNAKSFLGYNKLDESALPEFRQTYEEYMTKMGRMSMWFTSLIAEAVGLPSNAFDQFFDGDAQQHKLKIVKYPDLAELGVEGEAQGVGPHKDSMLSSYLLQASHHRGLQVQNGDGQWVDCPPIDGTFVVAVGQGMEALTQGVCQSTTHRVQSPQRGSGARYSIPFFQGVSYDATFESMEVPQEVKKLREDVLARRGGRLDDIEFTFVKGMWKSLGEATLMNRIKSHPDVSEIWVSRTIRVHTAYADHSSIRIY
ncbi:hypothetical protein LTS08_002059 [Lithohypha guttulata]|nr:hypothetical protein LTS08_002059 [Lithohypha guttulata]